MGYESWGFFQPDDCVDGKCSSIRYLAGSDGLVVLDGSFVVFAFKSCQPSD